MFSEMGDFLKREFDPDHRLSDSSSFYMENRYAFSGNDITRVPGPFSNRKPLRATMIDTG